MCGRFTLKTPVGRWLADLFPSRIPDQTTVEQSFSAELLRARYNITPSQQILVLHFNSNGSPIIDSMRWGLVPVWADSLSVGYNMINARSESIADKPSFQPSLIDKRCVILADGYYEWKKLSTKTKEPYWIHTADECVFAMAGLWAENRKIHNPLSQSKSTLSATIITTESNTDVMSVHDRMPALMLNHSQIAAWLDPTLNHVNSIDSLLDQLQPCARGLLQLRRVSTLVNNPANDENQLLNPI